MVERLVAKDADGSLWMDAVAVGNCLLSVCPDKIRQGPASMNLDCAI